MRRIVFIVALVLVMLLASLFAVSLFALGYVSHTTAVKRRQLVLYPGRVMYMLGDPLRGNGPGFDADLGWWPTSTAPNGQSMGPGPVYWWFTYSSGTRGWLMEVPIWSFAVPLLAMAWFARPRKRSLPGHCNGCGYDLRGLAGTCPECGALV